MENGKKLCKYTANHACRAVEEGTPTDCMICLLGSMVGNIHHILNHIREAPVTIGNSFNIYNSVTSIRAMTDGFNKVMKQHFPEKSARLGQPKIIMIVPLKEGDNPLVI